ncbi:MAG TPA: hypothetical protein VGK45_17570 [Thermoanaerobaculia bacterium]
MSRRLCCIPVLAALLLALAACSAPRTVKTYDKSGLRFSYLSDWMVTTDMLLPRDARVRQVLLNGPDHALLMLLCFPEDTNVTAESFAASSAKGRAGLVKKGAAPFTSRAVTAKIAGQNASGVEQTFDLEILGQTLPHQASYYLVHTGGLKVVITAQAAQQHLADVQPGWQKVFDTLAIEPRAGSGGLTATVVQ